ncbi:hypothetical protein BKA70DRAFT_1404017 [Coprinopsis sp. MPI-PUGE-AT-0042]|nr:hypothetical protein BKA70DRAFT_1404017 [Coprinopsis sp. MPI-PUGE-AT-0042]
MLSASSLSASLSAFSGFYCCVAVKTELITGGKELYQPIESESSVQQPFRNSMARGRQGKRGTAHHRNIIQGSNGLTINGGTYANGDAPTTIQYNLLAINVNGSPSLNSGWDRVTGSDRFRVNMQITGN